MLDGADSETVRSLRSLLADWENQFDGDLRVELRLINKHTGQLVPADEKSAGCGPRYPLNLLAFELDEAVKAMEFVAYLKRLGREIVSP